MLHSKLEKKNNHIILLLGYITFAILPALCILAPRLFGTLLPALGSLLYITLCIQQRKVIYPGSLLLILFISMGTLFLASLFWTVDFSDAIERIFKVTFILLSGILLITFCAETNQSNIHRPMKYLYIPLTLALFFLIEEHLSFNSIHNLFTGMTTPRNITNRGAVILSLIILPLIHLLTKKNMHKHALILFICTLTTVIIFSRSETALLALILSAFVWLSSRILPNFTFIFVSFIAILTLYIMPWASQWGFLYVAPILEQWRGSNASVRLEIWDFVSRYIMQSPITGYGIEAAKNITEFDSQHIYFKGKMILHPHNGILQIWLELGLIGIVLFNTLIGVILMKIRKLTGVDRDIALALFTSIFSISLTGYGIWQSWWLGTIFIAIALFVLSKRFVFPVDKINIAFIHKKRGSNDRC